MVCIFVSNLPGLLLPIMQLRAMSQKENGAKKSRIRVILVILIVACTFLVSPFFALWLVSESSSAFRANLKELILKKVICEDLKINTNVVDAIYLLGGSQKSLELKFKTAATLYHDGICKRILILSRPGKAEYSRLLGRNFTNDEWAILKLEKLGIPKKNIEAIRVKKAFFGTLTEAKGISRLIKKRGYKSVLLISSPYHTHRAKISFEKFIEDHNVAFYMHGSGERGSLRDLIIEFIKLKVYEYLLVS